MDVTFDPAKRDRTRQERGLDFADAREVFEGDTLDFEDERQVYPKRRFVCVGHRGGEWSSSCGHRGIQHDTSSA